MSVARKIREYRDNEDTHDEGRLTAKTPMSEQALGNTPPIDQVKPQYRPSQANLETDPVDYFSFRKRVKREVDDAPSQKR